MAMVLQKLKLISRRGALGASVVMSMALLAGCVVVPAPGYRGMPQAGYEGAPVAVAPPAYPYESMGVAPGVGYFWIGGHWGWGGHRHVWVPGRWMAHREGHRWEPHRWQSHGGRWHESPGHWKRR
jgi:hypothetical protein